MRRLFPCLLILMLALSSCTSLRYAGVNRVRSYDIGSPDVPEAFDGYRIAFASDFHLESKFKERQLRGTVKALQALAPDVVMLGGDYQEGCEYVAPLFEALAEATPPDGIYAVLGNNDYERCTELIRSAMQEHGIHLLEQAVDTIYKGEQYILVWGANPYAGRYPTARAKRHAPSSETIGQRDFTILLTHTPDYVEDADISAADLALAGHTHGGQVTLFGLYAPITASKYGMRYRTGLKHNRHGIPIIISNGLGTSRRNIRFCAPTDIVVVTLQSK
ncbi:MAG: metallophosphoesterase [Bacteroidaceae bacterium]|nr:metallophosphoesterase [Bacteroidaceae bacterium]